MKYFVKTKPFLLFLLIYIIPIIILIAYDKLKIFSPRYLENQYILYYLIPIALLIHNIFLKLWSLSVGCFLSTHKNSFSFRVFKLSILYEILFTFFIASVITITIIKAGVKLNSGTLMRNQILIKTISDYSNAIYLFLISIIFNLYATLFLANKIGNLKNKYTFLNKLFTFILLLLFPIGLWPIQHKINSLS
jgi:hypothetical protein